MTDLAAELETASDELAAYFADPGQFSNPYDMFRRLRDQEPVHWSKWNSWVVTGHPEALELLQSKHLGRAPSANQQFRGLGLRDIDASDVVEAVDIQLAAIINRDPPDHTRLRRLVSRAFSPRVVMGWDARIRVIVDQLVDNVQDLQQFDLLHDLAYLLPATVICELLNVPFDEMQEIMLGQGLSHTRVMTVRGKGAEEVSAAPDDLRRLTQNALVKQTAYFRELIAERKRKPGDDLISTLAMIEDEGDVLSTEELIGTTILLIGAGHETTANLIGNGMYELLTNRSQFELLKRDPDLMPVALEEILRYATPSRGQPRTAIDRIEIAGKTIEPGDQVSVILMACNRDPRVFDDPETFDLTRTDNRHITFTAGVHYCLGAALAKAEAAVMFRAICDRLGDLELAVDEVKWRPAYVRGLVELPVRRG
ncbi:MAG: cytochrome P450 [Acidimicrobiia bacterium]